MKLVNIKKKIMQLDLFSSSDLTWTYLWLSPKINFALREETLQY